MFCVSVSSSSASFGRPFHIMIPNTSDSAELDTNRRSNAFFYVPKSAALVVADLIRRVQSSSYDSAITLPRRLLLNQSGFPSYDHQSYNSRYAFPQERHNVANIVDTMAKQQSGNSAGIVMDVLRLMKQEGCPMYGQGSQLRETWENLDSFITTATKLSHADAVDASVPAEADTSVPACTSQNSTRSRQHYPTQHRPGLLPRAGMWESLSIRPRSLATRYNHSQDAFTPSTASTSSLEAAKDHFHVGTQFCEVQDEEPRRWLQLSGKVNTAAVPMDLTHSIDDETIASRIRLPQIILPSEYPPLSSFASFESLVRYLSTIHLDHDTDLESDTSEEGISDQHSLDGAKEYQSDKQCNQNRTTSRFLDCLSSNTEDRSSTISARTPSTDHGPGSTKGSTYHSPTKKTSKGDAHKHQRKNKQKRKRSDSDEDDDTPEGDARRYAKPKSDPPDERIPFRCLYHAFAPDRFSDQVHRYSTCSKPFESSTMVEKHLREKHKYDEHCYRCLRIFPNEKATSDHLRAHERCVVVPDDEIAREMYLVKGSQRRKDLKALGKKNPKISHHERWIQMFRAVFPEWRSDVPSPEWTPDPAEPQLEQRFMNEFLAYNYPGFETTQTLSDSLAGPSSRPQVNFGLDQFMLQVRQSPYSLQGILGLPSEYQPVAMPPVPPILMTQSPAAENYDLNVNGTPWLGQPVPSFLAPSNTDPTLSSYPNPNAYPYNAASTDQYGWNFTMPPPYSIHTPMQNSSNMPMDGPNHIPSFAGTQSTNARAHDYHWPMPPLNTYHNPNEQRTLRRPRHPNDVENELDEQDQNVDYNQWRG